MTRRNVRPRRVVFAVSYLTAVGLVFLILSLLFAMAALAGSPPLSGFHMLPEFWRPLVAVVALTLLGMAAIHLVAGLGSARRGYRSRWLGIALSLLAAGPALVAVVDELSHQARSVNMGIYAVIAVLYAVSAWSLLSARSWFEPTSAHSVGSN